MDIGISYWVSYSKIKSEDKEEIEGGGGREDTDQIEGVCVGVGDGVGVEALGALEVLVAWDKVEGRKRVVKSIPRNVEWQL